MSRLLLLGCALLAASLLWVAETGYAAETPDAEKKIEEALAAKTTLEFVEAPLQDVVDYLKSLHEIPIVLDRRALDDVGIGTDSPITVNLKDISLESVLKLTLRELDLTWTIRHEVLLITTAEEAETLLLTRVYDVGDLVICRDPSGDLWADYDTLIETVTSTIAPESWADVGGPGAIAGASFQGAEALTVAQTYQIHRRIEKLLESLRQIAAKKEGNAVTPLRDKPPSNPMGGFGGMGGMGGGGKGSGGMGGGGSSMF